MSLMKAALFGVALASHYEKPPCQSDEQQGTIGGGGTACLPKCTAAGTCPTDVAKGVTASPECALQDQSGNKYCGLICQTSSQCGDATCQIIQGTTGVCTYKSTLLGGGFPMSYEPFLSEASHMAAFEQFVKEFEKDYAEDEKEARYAVFKENRVYVHHLNMDATGTEYGLNQFSDLSHSEFKALHLNGYRPDLQTQWGTTHLGTHEYSGAALPKSVDWTTKGAVTPIKNQGQCGSCWAFSTTGSMEGAWQIATGKLVSLSEQQLVDCSSAEGNQGCSGGLMDNGFKYEEISAVCTEESYPYKGVGGSCAAPKCTVGIPKGDVTGFKDVAKNDKNALMEALALGPVSIAIEADKSAFQFYKSGVLAKACGTQLDHGVLAVGYGTLNGVDYWKVKNSWGATWGQEGFILLARDSSPDGAAGECGLMQSASYPVVKGSPSPGPSPTPPSPTPPSPTPPSPTPPSPTPPGKSHYEHPPCQADETQAKIQGLDGSLCAPKCTGSTCPSDKPQCRASPKCALQDQSGDKYCALMCLVDGGCPTGAKCGRAGGLFGVCYYPGSKLTGAVAMTIQNPWVEGEVSAEIDLVI